MARVIRECGCASNVIRCVHRGAVVRRLVNDEEELITVVTEEVDGVRAFAHAYTLASDAIDEFEYITGVHTIDEAPAE